MILLMIWLVKLQLLLDIGFNLLLYINQNAQTFKSRRFGFGILNQVQHDKSKYDLSHFHQPLLNINFFFDNSF